jgi:hypothetical protein
MKGMKIKIISKRFSVITACSAGIILLGAYQVLEAGKPVNKSTI